MKKNVLILLVAVALAGLLASILMTRLHYKMASKGLEERSFCHVSEFFDCDSALASRYSHFDTGIKAVGTIVTSEVGALYYALVLLGLGYAFFAASKSTLAFLLASSFFASLYSVILGYISVSRLGVICLLCFTTYLVNFLLLLILPAAMGIPYRKFFTAIFSYIGSFLGLVKSELPPRRLLHGLSTLVFVVVGLFFFRGLNPRLHATTPKIPKDRYLAAYYAMPQKTIETSERPVWGRAGAKVTITEFSDFQCPFCRMAAFNLRPALQEFKDQVQFVFMNFPLDNACNPAIEHSMHPVSCLAAKAAICSNRKGKFWNYHDRIFENQKKLSREKLLSLAEDAGMDRKDFEQCLVSDDISAALKKDVDEGNKLEVHGTPTVYINGRAFRDWTNPARLRMVLESEISGEKPPALPPVAPAEDHANHPH